MLQVALHKGTDPEAFEDDGVMIRTWEHGYSNFLSYLKSVLVDLDMAPRQIIFCLDAEGSRKMRQRIHKGYKAHRVPQPDSFYAELATLSKQVQLFIKELGGTVAMAKGYEADDLIAHIAQRIENCVVLSTDKDLIFANTHNYIKGAKADEEDCGSAYLPGLNRNYIPLYRALVGDSKDFGPGTSAKGFGAASFLKFWTTYGDEGLDQLISQIEDEEQDLPDTLFKSQDMIRTTWKLANWLPISYYRIIWEPGYAHDRDCSTYDEEFDEYYQTMTLVSNKDFRSDHQLLCRTIRKQAEAAPYVSLDIETSVGDESDAWLRNIAENFSRAPIMVDVHSSKLTGLSITVGNNLQETYYFPVDHFETENIDSQMLGHFITSLKNDFVAHNAGGFELPVLNLNWKAWIRNMHCSQIAAGYVDENRFSQALKSLSKEYFNYRQTSYQEVTQGRKMNELTGEETLAYGCDDTIMAGSLMNHFITIMQLEGSFDAFLEVESNAMYMVASSFVEGVDCDLKVLEDLREKDRAVYETNYQILTEYLVKTKHKSAQVPYLEDFTASEIKKAYLLFYGEPFKCSFRVFDKVIDKMPDCEFKIVLGNKCTLDEANRWLSEHWTPKSDFKVNSPTQVPELLYDHMKCPVMFRNHLTKKQREKGMREGNRAGDESAVAWAIKYDCTEEQITALKALQRCKAFLTRDGLYYTAYRHLVHWQTGKLHPNLKQSKTTSRRFAPAGPNVNQQPKRNEEGKKVRRCILPHHKDAVLISPDKMAQELRHTADDSGDENFLACFIGDDLKDVHTLTAFEICQKQDKEFDSYQAMVNAINKGESLTRAEMDIEKEKNSDIYRFYKLAKDYRGKKAKATNFLSSYVSLGGGADTLSRKLQIPLETAQDFLDAKANAFPGVDVWKAKYTEKCRKTQLAFTRLGGVKHLHGPLLRGGADAVLRSAVNFRIQSSSAEEVKLIMGRVWVAELLERYDARFLYGVHDEVLFSVAKKDLTAFCLELRPIMEAQYANMVVPCLSSLCVGYNFGQMDEISWDGTEEWLFNSI
jgi:DNA polymerase I-like protein with 3'-5' exonuclease and polymerase domains